MKNFEVKISNNAMSDIDDIFYFIDNICKSPITARKYIIGIFSEIRHLKSNADVFQFQEHTSILKYGHNARRINYKKIAIIYTIHNDTVVIRRVIPGGIIKK